MNPFVSHRILNDLPFDLMKNPDKAGIEQFVEKKRQRYIRIAILCVLTWVVLLTLNINIFKPEISSVLNTLNPFFWLVMGVIFFRKSKTTRLENDELDELLEKFPNESEMSA